MNQENNSADAPAEHLQVEVAKDDQSPAQATTERQAELLASLLGSRVWIPVFIVSVIGCVLRLLGFDAYWVNSDEGIYYAAVNSDSWERFWIHIWGNAHPPLYYLILRGISWLSVDVGMLRSVSLVSGCLWAPGMFLLMRECVGMGARVDEAEGDSSLIPSLRANAAGLILSLIIALAPGAIMLSSVMRPYALELVVLIFGLYFMVRYIRRGKSCDLPLYTCCMAIALFTHYSAILLLGIVGITLILLLLFRQLERKQAWRLLFANSPLLVMVLLLYFLHIRQIEKAAYTADAATDWLKPYLFGDHLDAIFRLPAFLGGMFGGFNTWAGPLHSLHGVAGLLFVLGVCLGLWQRRPLIYLLPLVSWIIAALLSYVGKYPFGASRHSAYLTATTMLPLAYALSWAFVPTRSRITNFISAYLSMGLLVFVFIWREEMSAVLAPSVTRVPALFMPELNLRRVDMEHRALPALEKITNVEGTIVMDRQTLYLLMPLYYREQQRGVIDGQIESFRWGERTVVVDRGPWFLTLNPNYLDKPNHLLNSVKQIDREMPELGVGKLERMIIIAGGFGRVSFGYDLIEFGKLRMTGNLVYAVEQMSGLHVIEYNLAQFMIDMEVYAKNIRQSK